MDRRVALVAALLTIGVLGLRGQDPAASGAVGGARVETLVVRLRPGQDLRKELQALVDQRGIEAAAVVTCVGSLERVALRFADAKDGTTREGKHEVVSLVGTLSKNGSHLHLAASDGEGRTVGGHLLEGCVVYTTAEVVLALLPDLRFRRELDAGGSGFKELVVDLQPR